MGSIKQNYANNVLTSGKFDATDLTGTIPSSNINNNSIDNVTGFPAAGSGIPAVASDPPAPTVGDVWYNTTTNALKYAGVGVGSWAAGGNLNNARQAIGGDGGTSSAAFAAGGVYPGYYSTTHEQYDGSTWTSATAMNTSRAFGGAGGTQTAAFVATGRISPTAVTGNVELWNGSSWTEVNNVNSSRFAMGGGLGTQTAGLIGPGSTVPAVVDSVESWDGTNWTAVTTYPGDAHEGINQFGTSTSAIFAGGFGGPTSRGGDFLYKDAVFEWNGSTFSSETSLPTIRGNAASVGTVNDGLISGGWEGSVPAGSTTTNTTSYDGTTWTELNNLANTGAGYGSSKSATTSDTIVFGGSDTVNTEEWTIPPFSAKSVTTA